MPTDKVVGIPDTTILPTRNHSSVLQNNGSYVLSIPINVQDEPSESTQSGYFELSINDMTAFNDPFSVSRSENQLTSEEAEAIELDTYKFTILETEEVDKQEKATEDEHECYTLQYLNKLDHSTNGAFEDSFEFRPKINVRTLKIEKTSDFLGFTIRNDGESVIIGRIVKGGSAEKLGQLREGDEILAVNGINVQGKSIKDISNFLSGITGTLTFTISSSKVMPINDTPSTKPMHIKAYFDYDPEDDPYIPCRELGISFAKGDILHVVNQDDPDWWQAYRDGEIYEPLAGLIPSKAFQEKREEIRLMILNNIEMEKEVQKKKVHCFKTRSKERTELNYFTEDDDEDNYENLTYERVNIYFPTIEHKRPVILVGPRHIGISRLRERLLLENSNLASPIPHTSRPKQEREEEGVEYYFVSRAHFEKGIMADEFVEFSYKKSEKAFYGTKFSTINNLINLRKTCILCLFPPIKSLKRIKYSGLMPYIIFIAPPLLQRLQKRKEEIHLKEKDLKEIVQLGREMEQKHWPYFDLTFINIDQDNTYKELLFAIRNVERQPQFVPTTLPRQNR